MRPKVRRKSTACFTVSNSTVTRVISVTPITKSVTMSKLSVVILLAISTLVNSFVPALIRFAVVISPQVSKQIVRIPLCNKGGNGFLDADIQFEEHDRQHGDNTEGEIMEAGQKYDGIKIGDIERGAEGKLVIEGEALLPAGAPSIVEEKKKKKKLLSSEIIRESTIVLCSADEPVNKKGSRRRGSNHGYALIRRTLLHYKMRYGDMLVPVQFSVPGENEDWPKEMWDMKLGKVVQTIRSGRRADKQEDLLSIGFCYGISNQNFENVKTALLTYKKIHKNLFVPRKYVVPSTKEYSAELWGMKLGNTVSGIRTGVSCYVHKRVELEKIGFCFDVRKERRRILELAVLCYSKRYSGGKCDLSIGENFVIPKNSEWPEETWGFDLGKAAKNVRRGRSESISNIYSNDVAISFVKKKKLDYKGILETVEQFYQKYGTRKIPQDYKIPKNDDFYSERAWGICLGSIVGRIRRGEKWPEQQEEFLLYLKNGFD